MFKYSICLLFVSFSFSSLASKANCAYELSKLKSIQHAMRTIYNSENMIIEEQRRYAIYKNCKENVKSGLVKKNKHKLNKKKKNNMYNKKSIAKNTNLRANSSSYRKQVKSSKSKSRQVLPKKSEK